MLFVNVKRDMTDACVLLAPSSSTQSLLHAYEPDCVCGYVRAHTSFHVEQARAIYCMHHEGLRGCLTQTVLDLQCIRSKRLHGQLSVHACVSLQEQRVEG